MLSADGAQRVLVALLAEIDFAGKYLGYFERHRDERSDDHPGVEVEEALAASPVKFKRNARERFLGARYRVEGLTVQLNVIPRPGQIEVVSAFRLPGGLSPGGTWHGLALAALRHEDPYALYNPPYPRLPCGPRGPSEPVAFLLALHEEMLGKVLADPRFRDPARAEDPPPGPRPEGPVMEPERLKDAFLEAVAGVGMVDRALALRERCEGPRGGALLGVAQIERVLAARGLAYTRTDLQARVDLRIAAPIAAMPCHFTLVIRPSGLDLSITVDAYQVGGLGGTLGYLAATLAERAGRALPPGVDASSWLHASTEPELAELLDEGLALFSDVRAALSRTPIPRFSQPGRLSARWPGP